MRTVYAGQTASLPITVYNQAGAVISATISSGYLTVNGGSPINCTVNGQTLIAVIPSGATLGEGTLDWSWHQVGSDGYVDDPTFTEAVTIATAVPSLTGPFTATTLPAPVAIRVGDTLPAFTVMLADANGAVDIGNASLALLVRAAWSPDNIAGGSIIALSITGQAQCSLPPLSYDGSYYAAVEATWPGGQSATFPNTGPGFLISAAPAIVTS